MSDIPDDNGETSGPEGWHMKRHNERKDIGGGVRISYYGVHGAPDGVRGGIFLSHIHEDGKLCHCSVMFDIPETASFKGPKWNVESWDPLTLSPSILQKTCGLHGFIREGKWVSA